MPQTQVTEVRVLLEDEFIIRMKNELGRMKVTGEYDPRNSVHVLAVLVLGKVIHLIGEEAFDALKEKKPARDSRKRK